MPCTSRQRDRERAGETERRRDRERDTKGQGNRETERETEKARLYDPKQLQQNISPLTSFPWK